MGAQDPMGQALGRRASGRPEGHEERRAERQEMVDRQLRARGIGHERVLRAMAEVPRELFVPDEHRQEAYDGKPLPTPARPMAEPYATAVLLERLDPSPGQRILDCDPVMGYRAAVLASCGCEVFVLHRDGEALERMRAALQVAGLANRVRLQVGDVAAGWPEHAPYERVLLPAGAAEFSSMLAEQLAPDGEILSLHFESVSAVEEERVPQVHRYRLVEEVVRRVDAEQADPLREEAGPVTEEPRPEEKAGEPLEAERLESPRPRDERGMNPGASSR